MNSRLSSVARATGVLNPHQCGSLARLSASDAVTTLTHEVKTLQLAGRKVSTLFLDIKGSFDNVNPATICGMVSPKGVNPYLVSWTKSFLSGRSCRLLYQGSPRGFRRRCGGHAPGLPSLPALVRHLRFPPSLRDHPGPLPLLSGRLCSACILFVL